MAEKFRRKKRIWLVLAAIVVLVGGGWLMLSRRQPQVEYTTVKATRGRLVQTVSETGTLKPVHELELNFLNQGKILSLPVKVGDQVKPDDVLAKLDDADYLIKVREASADLLVANAKLDKLLAGAASVDIAVAQANYQAALDDLEKTKVSNAQAVAQAQKTYDDLTQVSASKSTYQQTYDNKVEALVTTLDNKLIVGVAALDAVKKIINDTEIKNYLSIGNIKYLQQTKDTVLLADDALDQAELKKVEASAAAAAVKSYYDATLYALNLVFKDLNYCFSALEASITSADFTPTELADNKSTISTQATTITAAIAALQSAKQAWDDAKVAWDNAIITARNALETAKTAQSKQVAAAEAKVVTSQAQLKQTAAKARPEDIALARGQVAQAQAALDLARNQLANSVIKAPLTGVVTKVNYQPGEQTTTGKAVLALIAENNYEIEIDVAETDIAKVHLNDAAQVTLDAYGEAVKFEGRVVFIEPAETVIQGVTYYKVKVDFSPGDKEIKPGMTATVAITTAAKDDVIMIPLRAVINQDNKQLVRVLVNGAARDSQVQLGLMGDDGLVEALSGVKAGEEVITFTKNNGKK